MSTTTLALPGVLGHLCLSVLVLAGCGGSGSGGSGGPPNDVWISGSTGLFGGRVTAIAIDQTGAAVYAGTAKAGVFKSTDGGATWIQTNAGLTTTYAKYINALAIDPASTATIYAGTYVDGVFKSTDGVRGSHQHRRLQDDRRR